MTERIECEYCPKAWEIPEGMSRKEEDKLWNRVYQHFHKHKIDRNLTRPRRSKYLNRDREESEQEEE